MSQDNLLDFIQAVSGDTHLSVEEDLGEGFVRLKTAEAERRQAKHDIRHVEDIVIEMLRNARDAHASTIYLATGREADIRSLVFIDDGDGIPAVMHEAIFEPRVTSKLETMIMDNWGVHGRGMALYSIKSNTLSSRVVSSAPGKGSSIAVSVDLNQVPERSDQSSMPVLEYAEDGKLFISSGPHNIARTLIDFSIDMKDKVRVYLGSHAEIAATLVESGRREITDSKLLFCDDIEDLPVTLRLAAAGDAAELARACESIGLNLSERTAHRILANHISPSTPPLEQLVQALKRNPSKTAEVDIYRDSRGLKISKEDLAEFRRSLELSFASLSSRYYIDLVDEPIIRVGKDAITVKFPFDKEL